MAAAPPIIAASLWPDPKVERAIFGTADPEAIWEQVLETCPEAVGCFAFRVSIGASFGLELCDGSRVALKIHTGAYSTEYLVAAQAVQEHLWRRGFPCPRPLGVRGRATVEEWRDEGVYRDGHVPEVRRALAVALARLIELTDELRPFPRLPRGCAFPRRVTQPWPPMARPSTSAPTPPAAATRWGARSIVPRWRRMRRRCCDATRDIRGCESRRGLTLQRAPDQSPKRRVCLLAKVTSAWSACSDSVLMQRSLAL